MKAIHGGDIYRNQVHLDFSVNVNPLGMPKEVEAALLNGVKTCGKYPDISAEKLKKAVSNMLEVPREYLLFGNGASELFMAVVHGIRPARTIIPVPSFYGYEYAAEAVEGEVCYYQMGADACLDEASACPSKGDACRNDVGICPSGRVFHLTETFFEALTEDVDLLFLANPNNPTGSLLDKDYLHKLLCHCRDKGIYVVLDECFIEFCGKEFSVLPEISQFENLIIVRAFTKIFAIPGVRLGYLVCSNQALLNKIRRQLPEWNLSTFAQAAGCACAEQAAFVRETVEYVKRERQYLAEHLQELGCTVFPGDADFIFVYSHRPLYESLLQRGILIRDCGNFRGLSKGYYRIAVRSAKDNRILIQALREVKREGTDTGT